MKKISVKTGRPYEMIIGAGILADSAKYILDVTEPCHAALVCDSNVSGLYAGTVSEALTDAGFDVTLVEFPAGEENKNLSSYSAIMEQLARAGLNRSDIIIALGGGVTGDMAGFAAATYLRGIKYIQMPTTYLAAVDSSVGGKTAVDLGKGKNLCGAFWQPSLVLCDYTTFRTLSPSEMLDGSAEAYKSGMIGDASLLPLVKKIMTDLIASSGEITDDILEQLEPVIEKSVNVKREIVEHDEHDNGERQLLNFGHTFGHSIEKLSGYAVPHGQAVARGMVREARAAYKLGYTEYDSADSIAQDLSDMGFDLEIPYESEKIIDVSKGDKKVRTGTITIVYPDAPGSCALRTIPLDDLQQYIEAGL